MEALLRVEGSLKLWTAPEGSLTINIYKIQFINPSINFLEIFFAFPPSAITNIYCERALGGFLDR